MDGLQRRGEGEGEGGRRQSRKRKRHSEDDGDDDGAVRCRSIEWVEALVSSGKGIEYKDGAYRCLADGRPMSGLVRRVEEKLLGKPRFVDSRLESLWWACCGEGKIPTPPYTLRDMIRISKAAAKKRKKEHCVEVRSTSSRSSKQKGARVDDEICHLVNCCGIGGATRPHTGGTRSSEFASATRLPGRGMPCQHGCGLIDETGVYSRKLPRWSPLTVSYLESVSRRDLTLVASQVHVMDAVKRLCTQIDDVAVSADGKPVVVERKTGYTGMGVPPAGVEKCVYVRVPLVTAGECAVIPVCRRSSHVWQASIGALLASTVIGELPRSYVVYLRQSECVWIDTESGWPGRRDVLDCVYRSI
jgi:hypothetical protein